MEDYLKFFSTKFNKMLNKQEVDVIELYFKDEPGILTFTCTQNEIRINYNSFIQTESTILESIQMLGFSTNQSSEKKSAISKWLSKLAKSNRENFGNQRLDCCKINNN
jgi:hypothetical protein